MCLVTAEDIISPGTAVMDGCEQPCGYGELTQEGQPELLTTESSLQPHLIFLKEGKYIWT